jgi:N-acetylglucosamine-6-phosphate deacetylase
MDMDSPHLSIVSFAVEASWVSLFTLTPEGDRPPAEKPGRSYLMEIGHTEMNARPYRDFQNSAIKRSTGLFRAMRSSCR